MIFTFFAFFAIAFVFALKTSLLVQLALTVVVFYFSLKGRDGLEHALIFIFLAALVMGELVGDLRYYLYFYQPASHLSIGALFDWMMKP